MANQARKIKVPEARFNLKSHTDDSKEVLIYLFYRYGGNRFVWSTGEKVLPRHWDVKRGQCKAVRGMPEYSGINKRLGDYAKKCKQVFEENDFGNISREKFKVEIDILTGKKVREASPEQSTTKDFSFLNFIDIYAEEVKARPKAKRNTWKGYFATNSLINAYSESIGGKLDYDDMDHNFCVEFERWLYAKPQWNSISHVRKIFSRTKTYLRIAAIRGYHQNMKFLGWKLSVDPFETSKIALTRQDLQKLQEAELTPRLARVRDYFLVGCFTGLRHSDWSIKPTQVVIKQGVMMLRVFPKKTEKQVYIPVLPELKTILERYNYSIPKISNQKANDYLEEVCKAAKLNDEVSYFLTNGGEPCEHFAPKYERVTTHCARKTFATVFYQMGYPASMLKMITGHATEKMFFKYIGIEQEDNAIAMAEFYESNSKLMSLIPSSPLSAVR